jgi:hypothetical protein
LGLLLFVLLFVLLFSLLFSLLFVAGTPLYWRNRRSYRSAFRLAFEQPDEIGQHEVEVSLIAFRSATGPLFDTLPYGLLDPPGRQASDVPRHLDYDVRVARTALACHPPSTHPPERRDKPAVHHGKGQPPSTASCAPHRGPHPISQSLKETPDFLPWTCRMVRGRTLAIIGNPRSPPPSGPTPHNPLLAAPTVRERTKQIDPSSPRTL